MDPQKLFFTDSHEWIEGNGDVRTIGISSHAQEMLGDIVFVELPDVGKEVEQGEEFMIIESPKAAASVYAPVSGEIAEVNSALDSSPEKINQSPYEEGWLVKIKPSDWNGQSGKLMDHAAYEHKVEED